MEVVLSEAELAFRDEVRAFLRDELTEDLREAGRRCSGIFTDYPAGIAWHRKLAKRGWSAPHWPVEFGGCDWTPMQHYIFACELMAADAPPVAPNSTRMVAPVVIAFGTDEQKRKYLPAILNGDDYWAQGYSEPGSGSDLASLQLKAVREKDANGEEFYRLNGTKIWTTHAHWSNRMFCLVRTGGAGVKAQAGISFLLFDLPLPGINIRPIVSSSGDHELNQVFFDDVRVPVSSLLGEENQGWTVAKYLLQHERGGSWSPLLRARLRRLRSALDQAFAGQPTDNAERADLSLKLADAECTIDAVQAMEMRTLRGLMRGEPHGIRPSMGKILGSETRQLLTEIGVEIGAHFGNALLPMDQALLTDLPVPEEAVFAMSGYLNDRAASVYAGSNEIQRNIVAGDLLGRF